MPLHCAAFGCKSRQGCTDIKISFHRFPLRNPLLLNKWLSKIRRKDWEPTIFSRLCGRHFTSDDYILKGGRKWLKNDVSPSVFNFSSNFSETSNTDHNLTLKDLYSDNMPVCAAVNCSYKQDRYKIPGRTIHRFPFSRPDIVRQWVINIRRKNWKPSSQSILCSSHFEEKCFNRNTCLVKLKPDAVPTIFDYSSAAEKGSEQHSKRKDTRSAKKEVASNADDIFNTDSLSSKTIEKANTTVKKPSPVLSEEFPHCDQKFEHNYCSFPEITQDSVSAQTEENAAEPATTHLNENRKSSLDRTSRFSFAKLSRGLTSTKKPSKWWGLTKHRLFIMCTKWNEEFIAERKIIIDRKLNVKVFLYNSEVTNPELKRLQCAKDLSKLLFTVDSYRILTESEGLSLTNPTLSTISKMTS